MPFIRYARKYCRAGQATNANTAHAHCVLDKYGYMQSRRMCSTYRFSNATLVKRSRLNITLCSHCLYRLSCCGAGDAGWWRSYNGGRQALISGAACTKMATAATLNDIVRTGAANYIAQIGIYRLYQNALSIMTAVR